MPSFNVAVTLKLIIGLEVCTESVHVQAAHFYYHVIKFALLLVTLDWNSNESSYEKVRLDKLTINHMINYFKINE